jgi:hypothetical protein
MLWSFCMGEDRQKERRDAIVIVVFALALLAITIAQMLGNNNSLLNAVVFNK